ncbi:MAG TPA: hypothetical protein PKD73_03420 [Burkholderiaceae bacterium]|nr:hypothetical protein [Burkholderiaceae bacterium]
MSPARIDKRRARRPGRTNSARRQSGIVLIIGMVLLVMITLVVLGTFTLSGSNTQTVGNMQFRAQAEAAASKAIEQVLGSAFTTVPTAQTISVDINNDGTADYTVAVAQPVCISAVVVPTTAAGKGSSASLGFGATTNFLTVWDIQATVNDVVSSASTVLHQGVRVVLDETQKGLVCP